MVDESVYLEELSKQKKKIETALHEMGQGNLPDMKEIDRDVIAICGAIENAPPAIAKKTEQDLRDMIGMLEELASNIKDFQDSISSN